MLPTDKTQRKETPITSGVLDYFPDAIAAVARVSFEGNKQHNPGEKLHWSRDKSSDHADCIARHLLERHGTDADGTYHAAKLAWRALAFLQLKIEEDNDIDAIADDDMAFLDFGDDAFIDLDEALNEDYSSSIPSHDELGRMMEEAIDAEEIPVNDGRLDAIWDKAEANAGHVTTQDLLDDLDSAGDELAFDVSDDFDSVAEYKKFCDSEADVVKYLGVPIPYVPQLSDNVELIDVEVSTPVAYLAGPMTGYDLFNFPAFDAGKAILEELGFDVISPADLDRAVGIDPAKGPVEVTAEAMLSIIRRDVEAILSLQAERGDVICMMPGWEMSKGARAELALAKWHGLSAITLDGNDLDGGDE